MNTLNMQMFNDGNRTILVFNNCTTKLNEIIGRIVAEAGGQEQIIQNVTPINLPKPQPPVIEQESIICETSYGELEAEKTSSLDINERVELEKDGFRGFVKVYQFWKQNHNNLSPQRSMELSNFFHMYANVLKSTPASSYSDEALGDFLSVGLLTVFSDKLERLLRDCGLLTLDELLHGGRQIMEYCYDVCVGIQ